ncbi:MAG: methyltransferase domain-containing protein [Janthinobacterium lividum]
MKIAKRCVSCGCDRLERSPAILMPFIACRVFGWEPIEIKPEWGFRDVPAGQACSICNSLLCHGCGMLFLDMRFDEAEMAALYENYRGDDYTKLRARFELGYEARNALLLDGSGYMSAVEEFIEPHLKGALRILDWGGDTGVNTPFRDKARLHHIYDISNRPVLAGAKAITLEEIGSSDYDLFVFSNVLEHVPAPRTSLAEIASMMQPETVLYVEVPHEDVVRLIAEPGERLKHKKHWHEHINFFTPESLDSLFQSVGLRTIERMSHPVSAGGKDSHVFSIIAKRALAAR